MLRSTLDRGLAFENKVPAIVNLWVANMSGKNYLLRKEEPTVAENKHDRSERKIFFKAIKTSRM